MMPTMAKINEPTNVERTFCVTRSSIIRLVARGVTLLVAAEYADVIADNENVVTASIDEAIILSRLSTASAPSARSEERRVGKEGRAGGGRERRRNRNAEKCGHRV